MFDFFREEEAETHTPVYISGAEAEQVDNSPREPVVDITHLQPGKESTEMTVFLMNESTVTAVSLYNLVLYDDMDCAMVV